MLRGLMAATLLLLLLGPVAGSPIILGRLLVLREGWPGRGVKYQQVSVATAKNGAYKTSVNMILDQSAQRRSIRSLKSFRKYLETTRKNGCLNGQPKNVLKCIIFYKRKLYLIKSISMHNSKMHLETIKLILAGEMKSRKMWKDIVKNGKFQVKMNCYSILNVKKELQIYVENKYIETESSLGYIALQANMVLKGEERCVLKSQEVLESIMELKLQQMILKMKQLIETGMLQKKRYTQNNDPILLCDKERELSRENRNVYDKFHYGIFADRKKTFNSEKKGQYMGFDKYGLLSQSFPWGTSFLIREKTKVWKWKTLTKNCKFPFVDASVYQRNIDEVQKKLPPHKMVHSNSQGKNLFVFQRKMYRNKIGKWISVQMQPSVIHSAIPTIEIAIGVYHGEFNSEFSPGKPSLHMTKLLKHLMQTLQRVKKCFNVTQKRHRMKSLKALMVRKHLDTEDSFRTFLYLCKCISNSPLLVERSKRSAEGETVPISVDVLKRLTSALIAGATIFGIAIFALALAACYLYGKRRQLGQFFDTVLNDGKSRKSRKTSKSIGSKSHASLSQNFHFGQAQETRRNQSALAAGTEAYSKEESDFVTIKQIYSSSYSEVSSEVSLDHRSLIVRSRAYVSPSLSNQSVRSFRDDLCDISSSQVSLSDEIKTENRFSNPSKIIPKENEPVAVVPQAESLGDNQEQCTSTDQLPQLKKATDSSQLFFGEITIENQFSDLSTTKEKELLPVVPQPDSLCDNQEQYTSDDGFLQLKEATDSSQLFFGEITVENQCLNLSTTTPKEKEIVPVVPQPECLCNNQEPCTSSDLVAQLKKAKDSSQLCLFGEITIENELLNLSTTTSKEKELFPVVTQPEHNLCHNQEKCTSSDDSLKKKSITKSKSETDIRFSYSKMSCASQSLTYIYRCP